MIDGDGKEGGKGMVQRMRREERAVEMIKRDEKFEISLFQALLFFFFSFCLLR